MMVVSGGTVLTAEGWMSEDLAIDKGRVVAMGSNLVGEVIDAEGCFVGPGFVDLHTHLREPGQTWKEDVATGSRAAAAGGFTAVVAMPNTDPPIDSPEMVEAVAALGEGAGLVDVVPAAAMTRGRAGTEKADLEALYESGARLFTDDGDSVGDGRLLADIMETLARLPGAIVAQHAEDATMTTDGHMHEGRVSRSLGIGGLPALAEAEVVRRDLELIRRSGARYHCQHVSAADTVSLVRSAKEEGLPVTAEVTPHHLVFTEDSLIGLDTNFKMYPPLRSEDDRSTLVAALREGIIDIVATDHAPHTSDEKAVAFTGAPRGVIGLETAAAVTWEILGDRDAFFRVMAQEPARIAGLDTHGQEVSLGMVGNLVIFDPRAQWTPSEYFSRSANSPFTGRRMTGQVVATIHRGVVTHQRAAA